MVDAAGRLRRLELAQHDGDLLDALPPSEVVAVDAPLAVPNDDGQRDLERVLAWCDAPPFPASRQRLRRLHGRLRGVDLAPSLAATGDLVEAAPDLVLRQLAWERRRAEDAEPLELGAYREEWLGVRAPAYRPKGRARARPAGLSPAADLLGGVLDLGGWGPGGRADDAGALHDAARLDALACAYVAHLLATRPERALVLGTTERGRIAFPADANLRERVRINLERLREDGQVAI